MIKSSVETLTMPHDIEAEEALLSACMLDPEAVDIALGSLEADNFYATKHTVIFKAIQGLNRMNQPVDLLTVNGRLKDIGQSENSGGPSYLSNLIDTVPFASNAEAYALRIRDKFIRRRIIQEANAMAKAAQREPEIEDILDRAQRAILSLSVSPQVGEFDPLGKLLVDASERYELLNENPGHLTGIPTGLIELDQLLLGLQRDELYILAGRPGTGKTALALSIALEVARKGFKVAIFSLEMGKNQLIDRAVAAESGVSLMRLRSGLLGHSEWEKIASACGLMDPFPIFINDRPALQVTQLQILARRLRKQSGLDLVIVDYLQLLHGEKRGGRYEEVSDISRSLKNLAKDLNIPVLALSQLNRSVESRAEKIPTLSDLRESGQIEQDADAVALLYRDEVYNPNTADKGLVQIIVAKNRQGPPCTIKVRFDPKTMRFMSLKHEG
jgi:replicative DNA helicase